MNLIMRTSFLSMWIVAIGLLGFLSGDQANVYASTVHETIRNKLVYLHAKGQLKDSTSGIEEKHSYATGSLVSDDGLILTVWQLIEELGDVHNDSVEIDATIGKMSGEVIPAAIVDASIRTDLLLLKLVGDDKYQIVPLGNAKGHDDKPIYSSGFSKNDGFSIHPKGIIQNKRGQGGFIWTTNLDFEDYQRGSPVYNKDGKVIGVVKGQKKKQGVFYSHRVCRCTARSGSPGGAPYRDEGF